MLLAKEETVLQGMTDRLTEIGRCYRMELNERKLRQRDSEGHRLSTDYDRSERTGECGISQTFQKYDDE